MRNSIIIFILLFVISGCKSNRIIPESKMPEILTQIYIADAVWETSSMRSSYALRDSSYVYGVVTAKYGYTVDDLHRSLTKYAADSKLSDIYTKVNENLEKIKSEYEPAARIEELSVNQLTGRDSIFINIDSAFTRKNIDITFKEKGVYTVSAEVKFFADDSTQNPSMYVSMVSTKDSVLTEKRLELIKDTTFKSYSAEIIFDNDEFPKLKGYWLDYDTVNVKTLKPKRYRNKNKNSIIGQQHLVIRKMSVMYDFDASAKLGFDPGKQIPAPEADKLNKSTLILNKKD